MTDMIEQLCKSYALVDYDQTLVHVDKNTANIVDENGNTRMTVSVYRRKRDKDGARRVCMYAITGYGRVGQWPAIYV